MELPALGFVDVILLAVLAVSVIVGLVRGLVFELLSLAGWIVAWFAAQWLAPQLHAPLRAAVPALAALGEGVHAGVAFALAFVGTLLVWALLARLVRLLIHATPLSLPDRMLGAGFGLLRGGVLLLALATVVTLTPASQSTPWRSSQGARWLGQGLAMLTPLLPEAVSRHFRT
jgi:membrane protein required for colicin V production